jgi:nitrogen regulatory protein P-II 1
MKNIEAIIKPFKLDALKDRLRQVGAQGITVSEVRGFGRTGGRKDAYLGSGRAADFNPEVRIQMVSDDDMVQPIVEAIQATARTGEIGDGKVFVSEVVDAIRIRTGERGHDAL